MVLLDTTVLIDYLRGRPAADRIDALLAAGVTLCTTAINVEEIARGLRRKKETTAAERLVSGLVVLDITADDGWRAGTWRRDLGAKGITLSQADCLIAAAARGANATLATGNPKDFPMSGVRVEHWPMGE